ncbi:MAG: dihydroorotase [Acidobacteriota bacterium]|nr:dihydroorotase [Acidobacteriota bacterium]
MSQPFDLLVRGGTCLLPGGRHRADVGLRAGRIAAIGDLAGSSAAQTLDARGLHVLPGVIDTQVHFREPGLTHKEDLATGTAAAVLGGVTAIFEMPNTRPNTLGAGELEDKLARAEGRAHCHVAFFIGAAEENVDHLARLERLPGCAGVKVFMGSSTGSLLVESEALLERVLGSGRRRVAVHAEDEARLRERFARVRDGADPAEHPHWRDAETALIATRRLLGLARRTGRPVHVLHVSTRDEMTLLADARDIATVEVTPQHLTLAAPECYRRLGSRAQMNPPIRGEEHRDGLWLALQAGIVDVVGSDHAPHTREEKARPYPASPSGMPGVQTLLPLLLDHCARGRLSLERVVDLTSAGPARVYSIAGKGRLAVGYDADLTLVDLEARQEITGAWLASRCGWSPFEGCTVQGWPRATVVGGRLAMRDGEIVGPPGGRPVRFIETLGEAVPQ